MSDHVEKAKAIRRGEIDDELPDYEVITGWIQRVSITWLPGILAQVVTCCAVRKVFTSGGLSRFVERAERDAVDISKASLRDQDEEVSE